MLTTGKPVQYIATTTVILNKSSGSGRSVSFFDEDSLQIIYCVYLLTAVMLGGACDEGSVCRRSTGPRGCGKACSSCDSVGYSF